MSDQRSRGVDLVGPRKWFFLGSGIVVIASLILLAIPPSLRPGIEFTSGTTSLMRFERTVDQVQMREVYAELGHPEARIQSTGPNEYLVRTRELQVPPGAFTEPAPDPEIAVPVPGPEPLEPIGTLTIGAEDAEGGVPLYALANDDPCELGDPTTEVPAGSEATVVDVAECDDERIVYRVTVGTDIGWIEDADTQDFELLPEEEEEPAEPEELGERGVIEEALRERFGAFEVLEFSSVSPVVSQIAVRNAAIAVGVASVFIMGYIAFAFSAMPRPFRYATSALIALLHDVIIVLGAFSLFGKLFGTEVNLMFVTGLLTVIGYSVHDSIVTFDRVRENVRLAPHARLADSVNAALLQTMARSLNTSVTVLLVVTTLLLLGGATIQGFLLTILVGVIAGAYSSVGIAAQILVAWEEGDFGRFFRRLGLRRGERRAAEA